MKKKKANKNKKSKVICIVILAVILAVGMFTVAGNGLVVLAGKRAVKSSDELKSADLECILVLGAGLRSGNRPSPMLADRLDEGIRLYNIGVAPKIIVSGDHGSDNHDEVNVMKQYLLEAGIPDDDIFMDHAGFSTYESMYRARSVFGVDKMVVVTQKYHIYRAIYIAEKMGIEVYGSPADTRLYSGAFARETREWLARDKDIVYCIFKPNPKYLGEVLDIHGSGTVTNDN